MKPLYVSLKPFLDHQALPRPTSWERIFGNANPLEVEIGFGNGEYLARLAEEEPQNNFVGFEEYCERISRTLRKLSRITTGNVRVFRLDVRPAFAFLFSPRSIRKIHCLYPPPWPKKSDIKHRLMNTAFLQLANSRLVDGGSLKVVTDHKPYVEWMKDQVPGTGFEWSAKITAPSYDTKFERKWVDGGQREFHEVLLTKQTHVPVPVKEGSPLQHYTIEEFDPDQFQMSDFSDGTRAVAFKDYLYDAKRQVALVHLLVHDEHLLQSIRVMITKVGAAWRVHLAQGSMLMPTAGIALAIELVQNAARQSVARRV